MSGVVQYSSLGQPDRFQELGAGGEGRVLALPGRQDVVFKEFFSGASTVPNLTALERLVAVRDSWTPDEKSWMNERSVWPTSAVVDGNRLRGLLMPRIPGVYYRQHGIRGNPRRVPCEWNYLALRGRFKNNPNIVSDVPQLSVHEALELVLDLAKTIHLLHRYNIVLGDVSGRNLLWSDRPTPRVMVIDNDGFRFVGSGGVASPKQSPDWEDPFLKGQATSHESDVFKLALAAFRGIWSAGTDKPSPTSLRSREAQSVPPEVVGLIERSTQGSHRPSAADWVSVLSPLVSLRGRPSIALGATSPAVGVNSQVRQPQVNGPGRPVIPVRRNPTTS